MIPLDAAAREMVETVPPWVRLGVVQRLAADPDALAVIYCPWDPAPRSANRTRGRHWATRHQEIGRASCRERVLRLV